MEERTDRQRALDYSMSLQYNEVFRDRSAEGIIQDAEVFLLFLEGDEVVE